ncbi:MAG: hypothetical protein KC609_24035 [Myxococcales bacterium]|nr:hypothetical protein [Myxococcales bacterium]
MRSQTFRLSFLVLVLALTLSTGCKKGTTSDSKKKKKNEKRESDVFERKDAIAKLNLTLDALKKKDYDALKELLAVPKGYKFEDLKRNAPKLLERNEISEAGIKALSRSGRFAKLPQIFPDKAQRWIRRYGIGDANGCYGFGNGRAEVAFCKLDGKWKIIRLDDVGKIQ